MKKNAFILLLFLIFLFTLISCENSTGISSTSTTHKKNYTTLTDLEMPKDNIT